MKLGAGKVAVVTGADPWFGPLSAWTWVLGVNLWVVIHGIRAFLPILAGQGEGHIVNTARMAGLNPGSGAPYAASKHAVVAVSEELFKTAKLAGLRVGVSVLCPGWLRRLGRSAEARDAYRRALALVHDDAERRMFERRLADLPS
jgi:NAD(P)-dependent dehydrogenase (short-subunit alcohol dehydrogenase family)